MEMKKNMSRRNKACAYIRDHLISVIEKNTEGALPPDILDHLNSCPECALLFQRFALVWESPGATEDIQPKPSFFPEIIRKIEADEELGARPKTIRALAGRILRPAAVATLFLGGILAGYELGKAGKPASPSEESVASLFADSFEDIPRGSVADFYVNRQNSSKEGLK